ncbi:MAG: zinc ABC transporter substrate-binding protein [Pseudomonadota bacterium]
MKRILCISAAMAALSTGVAAQSTVVATVGMIGQPASEIGAACINVETMMGPGIDPHLYKPSAGDVSRLADADGVLYSGHNLEGKVAEVFAKLGERKPVLAVAEAAAGEGDLILPDGADYADPHLWMDVALWSGISQPIAELIVELQPSCTLSKGRAKQYTLTLRALDGWIREAVASIPEEQRILVTAHDAFAYYGRAYGIEVAGIQGVSTESEAGIADIRGIVDLVVDRDVPAIFVESTINPRTIEAVIEAAAARGHDVRLGDELFSDAMGEPGTAEGTYIGMLHANTVHIVTALGGTLPPLPEKLSGWAKKWDIGS